MKIERFGYDISAPKSCYHSPCYTFHQQNKVEMKSNLSCFQPFSRNTYDAVSGNLPGRVLD